MLQGKTPYASGHAGMTAVIMMVVATTMPLEVRDFAYHWWFQVALGVAVAMLVAAADTIAHRACSGFGNSRAPGKLCFRTGSECLGL